MGYENCGRPGGNPDIRNLPKTGPKTPEGKLKVGILNGGLTPRTNSKILDMFKCCNKCPLGPKEHETYDRKAGQYITITIPAKCLHYSKDGECQYDKAEFVTKMQVYYRIGEEADTLEIQKALNYSMLENAELAKRQELMTTGKPGKYTSRFEELASRNLESINKITYGEKHNNTNLNIDISEDIAKVWEARMKKRMEEREKENEN